jgi:cytoskeletal protein CcmA (bactofilin family)
MWWSKQAQPAAESFSSAFSSTGTLDPPVESPVTGSAGAATYPAVATKIERAPKLESMVGDDVRLDAVIEGSIFLKCQRLIVAESAKVTADIVAREVIVQGELHGHVQAAERVEIKRTATVTAELISPRIQIDPGAFFKGTVQIERRKKPRAATA